MVLFGRRAPTPSAPGRSHQIRGLLLCGTVAVAVLFLHLIGLFNSLELKTIDSRFRWRGNRPVHSDIVIVTVDEASIKAYGRWPWSRGLHARLVRRLVGEGALAVGFDTLFTESADDDKAGDAALAAAARDTGRVVSAFFFNHVRRDADGFVGEQAVRPYPALADASESGFVNLEPDDDGVTRRAPLVISEAGQTGARVVASGSLAPVTLAVARNISLEQALGGRREILINYAFDPASPTGYPYPIYSYSDALEGRTPPGTFKGKIVLVGATAAALFDMKAIPFVSMHPGVLVHANIIDNLMTGNDLRTLSPEAEAAYLLVFGAVLVILLPLLRPWAKLALFASSLGGQWAAAQALFSERNLVVPVVAPAAMAIAIYGSIVFYRLLVEEREKRKIKGSFRQYLSPKIIDIITRDPSKLRLGGEEREVSVFFLDIAGFTTMSEALRPTQLVEVMNHCLTTFSGVILRHDGLINKYIGDCIMAFWNAPADQPDHAAMACRAALDCIAKIPEINKHLEERGLPRIDCRVGISTGLAVVGNMGSNERFDYTVMGDTVNLASRLEGANKQYHTHVMISDSTFERAREHIEARDLDLIRVKGKREPKKVFEVLSRKGEMPEAVREARKRFHERLGFYRQQNFEEAIHQFETVFEFLPNDRVTRVYLERARAFVTHPPPPAWDGVYEMLTK